MKSFEFTEEQFADLSDLAKQAFDESDPRSADYNRELVRPKINWLLLVLFILAQAAISFALVIVVDIFVNSALPIVLSVVGFNLLYIFVFLKKIVLTAVKLYQFFAPVEVRMRCRFEPSCSQYMIMAVEKYGVFKGVAKGIGRLKRCNINDGGYDYP